MASLTSGQASLSASNSNTTNPLTPGTTSTSTTLPSSPSASIPMPTPAVMPANVTTGTTMPITVPVGGAGSGQLAYNQLPQIEINRHLNIYAAQVLIPHVFSKILEWGCPKDQADTFYDYITRSKGLTNTELKKKYGIFGKDDLNKLRHVGPSLMDVTLMNKVIQATCEKLRDVTDSVWRENDRRKAECLITMSKDCRNKICHEIRTTAISSQIFEDIVSLLNDLIQVGGTLYQKNSDEIENELEELRKKIDLVRTPEYERERRALQHLFHEKGYSETKRFWEINCSQEINMFSNLQTTHTDVFFPLDILPKTSSTHNMPMSYQEMFDGIGVDGKRPVLILQGEAGSGKSTILKQIAMEFFKLTNNTIPSLEEFHLLHFLQCNNQIFDGLKDFISKYFPETCKSVSPEDALSCFPYLGNLILIDGYDEVNIHSLRVTKQFIEAYIKNPACQIVFTARPSAVPGLQTLLEREGVQFNIYQLLEISQEKKQLDFLTPFGRGSDLCLKFSELPPDVKSFFVRPINLVQFYSLFLDSPDIVQKWKSINDVMRDIMSLYETLITSKLEHLGLPNLQNFIKGVLEGLCEFAFEGLIKRMFTLDILACDKLRHYCFAKIAQWGFMGQVDTNHILSAVYVTKVTPTKNALPTYQYSHKSMQELMSARSLLHDLTLDENTTLEGIIRARIRNLKEPDKELDYNDVSDGLQNVYKLVLMIFSEPDKRFYLLRWLPDLRIALTNAGADWQDVMMSCDRPATAELDVVAKIAAREKLAASIEWEARTTREVSAIARMLPHEQPAELDVKWPESEGTPSELATILKVFTGHLSLNVHHSSEIYTNCDHILDELNPSCSVTSLTGCLGSSPVSTRTLSVTLQQPGVLLYLTLENPSLHALQELQGKKPILNVKMKHHNPPTARRPLPQGFMPPLLIVEGTPASGAEEMKAVILHYAPEGGVYFSLWLENTLLDVAAIERTLQELVEAGIRTTYHCGKTCFSVACENMNGLCTHCSKAHTDASQRCVWLQLTDDGKGVREETLPSRNNFKAAMALKTDLTSFTCIQAMISILPEWFRKVIAWGWGKPEFTTMWNYILQKNSAYINELVEIERLISNKSVLDKDFEIILILKLQSHVDALIEAFENNLDVNKSFRGFLKRNNRAKSIIMDGRQNDALSSNLHELEDIITKNIIATGRLFIIDINSVEEEVTKNRFKFYKAIDECLMYQPAAQDQYPITA